MTSEATMDLFMWIVKDVWRSELASPPPPPPPTVVNDVAPSKPKNGRIFHGKKRKKRFADRKIETAEECATLKWRRHPGEKKIKYVRQRGVVRVRVVVVLTDIVL